MRVKLVSKEKIVQVGGCYISPENRVFMDPMDFAIDREPYIIFDKWYEVIEEETRGDVCVEPENVEILKDNEVYETFLLYREEYITEKEEHDNKYSNKVDELLEK